MTALPVFRQSVAMSIVTLGRASYITPSTPMGTRRFVSRSPFGRTRLEMSVPTGSGSWMIFRVSAESAARRSSLRRRRSTIASPSPAVRASSMSAAFAARIVDASRSMDEAIASSAAFFRRVPRTASWLAASRPRLPSGSRLSTGDRFMAFGLEYDHVVSVHDDGTVAVAEDVLNAVRVGPGDALNLAG